MTTYFVTRHAGAVEWATRKGFHDVTIVAHFDPSVVSAGDVVIGILPVHLAAEVCANGGEYHHLMMDLPAEARGRELSADDMESFGASVHKFTVSFG
jgi:CRISPR-associated protein Csx16